ncbi:MAG TPA: PEP-CTERM sorting domain-containing protein [Myxococcota bacterium]|nr:PEP-CTERM sorting domain-containing protein [Myxococcota bacterium]
MSYQRRTVRAAFALAAAVLLHAGEAEALTQFSLSLSPSAGFFGWDQPIFTITNGSTAGETITDLSISIGDTSYHFDAVGAANASEALTGASLLSPDRVQNDWWDPSGASDTLAWSFGDFDAGESLVFSVDLDLDGAIFGSWVDARAILFNNDFPFADPNAVVSASFSDGSVAALTLPDGLFLGGYAFASGPGTGGASAGGASVPEPSLFVLMGIGLVGLAWLGEPRRPSHP